MRPQRLTKYVLGLALVAGGAQSTTITTYNDVSAWTRAAKGGVITADDADDPRMPAGVSVSSSVGALRNGVWYDIVSPGTSSHNRNIWRTTLGLPALSLGIGGVWDLRPAGLGTGIKVTLFAGSQELGATELSGLKGGFWGFFSDTAFDRLVLSAGSGRGIQETYRLDELALALAPRDNVSPVPIPPAIWLFVSSLLGILGISRATRVERQRARSG